MPSIDIPAVERIIIEVATTEIMPRFRELEDADIEMKGINDPVTVADKAAENALTKLLTSAFPGSVVVGEESFAKDPRILSRFSDDHDVWVLDPIDGTRNFIAGVPEFGVMVALVRRKQTIAAWIHDPNTGDTLSSESGGGVWMRQNKMRLAGQDSGMPAIGLAGSKMRKFFARPEIAAVTQGFPPFVAGSAAAFDYARFFTGDQIFAKSDKPRASLLMTYRKAMPWDHLAGMMMVKESGGHGADWSGLPYASEEPTKGIMVTADGAAWEKLHALVKDVLASPDAP